jgi:xylulokinase
MASLLLGIDIGTTGSKALLLEEDGSVLATATSEYPMHTPQPLWAEQNPEDWWSATVTSIRSVVATAGNLSSIAAVGLTGQMHGLVLLDGSGSPLRPCIMWNDQRTAQECSEITSRLTLRRLLELTGNPVLPGFTAPKILWVRNHEPELYGRIAKVLLPKDFVRFRLSGAYAGDVSDSSGTSLFDVGRRRWSAEMLAALGIPPAWLPEVLESSELSGTVSSEAARATGLPEGIPVVAGAGDQAAQAIGSGIVREGTVSATLGTSGVVFAASSSYRTEPEGRLHAFCHAVPGTWHLMGVMLSAGGSLRWYRDTFGGEEIARARAEKRDPYDLLIKAAAAVPAGAEGVLFLPYLTGERTPYPNPHARGVLFGLTVRHTKPHITRAVLEGVTYGLRDSLTLMRALGIAPRQVRASGGGARSPLWRQIMADVFGTEITTVNSEEGAAYGAALLAGIGAGLYRDADQACTRTVRVTETCSPGPDSARYERLYPRYRALYAALEREFDELAQSVDSPKRSSSGDVPY